MTVGNDALLESAMKKARAAAAETADAAIWLYDEKGKLQTDSTRGTKLTLYADGRCGHNSNCGLRA